jgi:hypothetical protein
MREPDVTPEQEAIEVRPWCPGHPKAEIHVYPCGQEPALWIYVAGGWCRAVVHARHHYPFGTAYQVDISVPVPGHGIQHFIRTYRWGTPALQVRPTKLTTEQALERAQAMQEGEPGRA